MLAFRRSVLCAAVLALAACNGGGTTTDSGDAAADSPAPQDVVADEGGPPPTPMLLGPCAQDTDCPSGLGLMCTQNTSGPPGGLCTTTCVRDSDCPTDPNFSFISAVCRLVNGTRVCVRECLNGFDCGRDGYTCIKATPSATTGICTPSCSSTDCGAGARCNDWTGLCMSMSAPYPPAGVDDGQPCTRTGAGSECRSSHCIVPTATSGLPSGWNNGYCISTCRLTDGWTDTALYTGTSFPQSNCPTGAICFPNSNDLAMDGPGECFHGCMQDSDCRASEGYYCHKTFGLIRLHPDHTTYVVNHTWDNGICEPVDCLNDTSHPCPSGYTCQTQNRTQGSQTVMIGVCVAGGADAGTDAGSDASTDAALDGSGG
jgi:hypothetical protein